MNFENPAPASDYDQFVDWNKRLAREAPLFRWAFAKAEAKTVADVGAGSARHSLLFASWGMKVISIDPDDSMLAQAAINIAVAQASLASAGGEIELVRGGFGELAAKGIGPVDALVCTGNALPHVNGAAGLRDAIADFFGVLRPGGVLVLHLLNHSRLAASKARIVPPVLRDTEDGTKVFLRVIDYPPDGEHIDFDFVTLVRDTQGEWQLSRRRSPHTFIPHDTLERELHHAGFTEVRVFGNHERKPLDAEKDESIIVTATKGGAS